MHSHHPSRGERGSALVITMLMLIVMAILGSTFAMQSGTETQITGHHERHTQALYAAEAGVSEALMRMRANVDSTINTDPDVWQTEPGWGRYIVANVGESLNDPDVGATANDGLDNDSDGQVDEANERYPEEVSVQGSELDYPWVRVELKRDGANQVVLFGNHDNNPLTAPVQNMAIGDPVVEVTARGTLGTAQRSILIEASRMPVETVGAALYSESDDFVFNGTQFLISGRDWDPVLGIPVGGNPEVPGIATTGDPNNITDGVDVNQENNIEGDGNEPSVTQSIVDLDLAALAQQYASEAHHTLPSATYTNQSWGTPDDPAIVYFTGDITASGTGGGAGIMICDGDFLSTGQWEWQGLLIVLGDLSLTGGGSGFHLFGSLMVGGTLQQGISGNADIVYSSVALANLTNLANYTILSWREL